MSTKNISIIIWSQSHKINFIMKRPENTQKYCSVYNLNIVFNINFSGPNNQKFFL